MKRIGKKRTLKRKSSEDNAEAYTYLNTLRKKRKKNRRGKTLAVYKNVMLTPPRKI